METYRPSKTPKMLFRNAHLCPVQQALNSATKNPSEMIINFIDIPLIEVKWLCPFRLCHSPAEIRQSSWKHHWNCTIVLQKLPVVDWSASVKRIIVASVVARLYCKPVLHDTLCGRVLLFFFLIFLSNCMSWFVSFTVITGQCGATHVGYKRPRVLHC